MNYSSVGLDLKIDRYKIGVGVLNGSDTHPLKNTLLSIMLGLKSFPLIVIVLQIPPNAGSIESMTGWEKINDIKNNIDDIYLNILKSTNDYSKI